MIDIRRAQLHLRQVSSEQDISVIQRFRANRFGLAQASDRDAYDAFYDHFVIEDWNSKAILGCFRMLHIAGGDVDTCYSAQFYDLRRLAAFPGTLVELGRFCIAPGPAKTDALRLAWTAITQYVDARDVQLLFGCTSFQGTDPRRYQAVFSQLINDHGAPAKWAPGILSEDIIRFSKARDKTNRDKHAERPMPSLLRTYLSMGGWVSDHAVVDAQMNTMHVFTGLEIGAIPAARKKRLRALVQSAEIGTITQNGVDVPHRAT